MRKFGDPQAPDLKNEAVDLESVNIIADYRKNIIMYTYNPLYDNLNKYGYKPRIKLARQLEK